MPSKVVKEKEEEQTLMIHVEDLHTHKGLTGGRVASVKLRVGPQRSHPLLSGC